jgi:hypothetical protein
MRRGVCHAAAATISGGRTRELARVDDRPLQPLDGRREASAPSPEISGAC